MILTLIQESPIKLPSPADAENVKSILVYFVGLLITLLIIVVPFAILQINKRMKDKDNLISLKDSLIEEKEKDVIAIQLKLDKEIEYSKNIGTSTTGVLKDNTAVLKTAIKSLDEVGGNVNDAKVTVKENNSIVKDIKQHQLKVSN